MHEKLSVYIEQAIESLSSRQDLSKRLLKAKKIYEELTGKIDEDFPEYELKMLSFNDWFLFDFIDVERKEPFIMEFIDSLGEPEDLTQEVKSLCRKVRHSLFECRKGLWGSKAILENLLARKKYSIPFNELPFHLHSSEIFIGRVVEIDGKIFLFKGIQWLPNQCRPLLMKKVKKIRQAEDIEKNRRFVLRLEMVISRCIQFKRMNPMSIFESLV